jgi:glycosyltransferase involved in cell wall biosynthesis
MNQPSILFISPIVPLPQGIGLAMRAWTFLAALAETYHVRLLVIPVVPQVNPEEGLCELRKLGVDAELVANNSLEDAKAAVAYTRDLVKSNSFRAIHVFRLYMLPFIREIFNLPQAQRPAIALDMDDYESKTHARLAEHARFLHQPDPALIQKAKQFEKMEDKYLGRCQRVYVCTTTDRTDLARRFQLDHFRAVPNAVSVPPLISVNKSIEEFTLLFVGTLGYAPNEDAVVFFCHDILAQIRAAADRPVHVIIAGANPGPRVRALAHDQTIEVVGFAPDLSVYYQQAHAAIVPIRVGGGMRIKVLEAFSYHCPVVSTSIGAEGIEAIPEQHLLIADTAEDFANQCLRLMRDPALASMLAQQAYDLVAAHYSLDHVQTLIRHDYAQF